MPYAPYDVFEVVVDARPVAGVRATVPRGRVGEVFRQYLDAVYAAAQSHGLALDGQNIFIYRDGNAVDCTVDFCVGVRAPFTAVGEVVPLETPSGVAAMTTHRGDYSGLADANAAIIAWCRISRRELAGPSWEVYGHWHANPAQRRVDVYYLLRTNAVETALLS